MHMVAAGAASLAWDVPQKWVPSAHSPHDSGPTNSHAPLPQPVTFALGQTWRWRGISRRSRGILRPVDTMQHDAGSGDTS